MDIIQQLGCWKSLLQHKKQLWGLTLLKHTEIRSYAGWLNRKYPNYIDKIAEICWHIYKFCVAQTFEQAF